MTLTTWFALSHDSFSTVPSGTGRSGGVTPVQSSGIVPQPGFLVISCELAIEEGLRML